MSKDVNIHIKTPGAREGKRRLDKVGDSTKHVGGSVEKMGAKSERGGNKFTRMLGKMIGPLGIAGLATAAAAAAVKVAKFFDDIKKAADEAVRSVGAIREEYEDLFEAMDAYDEKSRESITKSTSRLLAKTMVPEKLGIPVVNEYTRQFKDLVETGHLSQADYNRGLEGMLSYGARHGGGATTDLIQIMRGWGMDTPEKQGELRRMISEGAAGAGLTDAEMIGALSRGMSTIRAMEWTPQEAVSKVARLAQGEAGRKKMSLPATTLQGLMAPQAAGAAEFGISEEVAQDPQRLYEELQRRRTTTSSKQYLRMLTKIYGTEAAAGVYKLTTPGGPDIKSQLDRAAGPEGAAAEAAEEEKRRGTMEARDARAKAIAREISLDLTEAEKYMEDVREIGFAEKKRLKIREPLRQRVREFFRIGEELEKEDAAYMLWRRNLSPEQIEEIQQDYTEGHKGFAIDARWQGMTPKEKYESLTEKSPVRQEVVPKVEAEVPWQEVVPKVEAEAAGQETTINYNYNYDNGQKFYPRVGDDLQGPRYTQD